MKDDVQHLIFWGTIASLAAALYYNTGTLWYVLVFSIVNGLRLLRLRGGQASPVFTIPALVISGMPPPEKLLQADGCMLKLQLCMLHACSSACPATSQQRL